MLREQIEQMKGLKICFEGVSKDKDEWLVVGGENTHNYLVMRNQGEHDRRFFIVGQLMRNREEAIEKAKHFCTR